MLFLLQMASAFVTPPMSVSRLVSYYFDTSHRHVPSIVAPKRQITLFLANNSTESLSESNSLLIQDSRLLVGDVVSIALASQLLGLVDVLNDPSFWQQGGWFQPMSTTQSTLPVMVQRDSVLTICWLLSALGLKGYNDSETDTSTLVQTAVSFCVVRVALGLGMSVVGHTDLGLWDSIRQCYFTIMLVGSFRFLYSQYTR